MEPIDFDPRDPAVVADPYPHYQLLRTRAPVYARTVDLGGGRTIVVAMLSRFADCAAVLHDPRFTAEKDVRLLLGDDTTDQDDPPTGVATSAPGGKVARRADDNPAAAFFRAVMLFRDAPDHTRIRSLVNKAFTPRRVEVLRTRIQEIIDELLEAPAAHGGLDLIHDLAAPLPIRVIAELLGVPPHDHAELKVWSDQAAMLLDGGLRLHNREQALSGLLELAGYLSRVIQERKAAPRDDLISGLVRAQEADDHLTDVEVLATCVLILGAGHETTTNLIGNGVKALLDHPDELRKLRSAPELVSPAVEELLRFDSPVQATSRIPTQPVEIAGYRIEAGCEVNTLIGAANRDPEQFPDPERLVIDRRDNRHLAFGRGAHFCLGAPLARLEGQLAIGTLVSRFPDLALAMPPKRRPGFVLRGYQSLALRF